MGKEEIKGIYRRLGVIEKHLRIHSDHPTDGTPGHQETTDNKTGNPNPGIPAPGTAPPEAVHPRITHKPTAYEKCTNRLRQAKPWIEAITVVVLIVYTSYTACSVSYSKKQWRAMEAQAGITQRQLNDYEDRESARLVVDLSPQITVLQKGAGALAKWNTKVRNVGSSVASDIFVNWSVYEIANANGRYAEVPGSNPDVIATPLPTGPHLAQGDAMTPSGDADATQITWWDAVINMQSTLVIRVQVSYRDIFTNARIVPACLYYDAARSQFFSCPSKGEQTGTIQNKKQYSK